MNLEKLCISKSKHGIKTSPIITTVNPTERREHPPAFACDSLDFKYYAPSQWQLLYSINTMSVL
jgi:hypothetical protein